MSDTIIESGMKFIADNSFRIEKSSVYSQLGRNIKSVEFVRSMGNKLLFIEAKSSFPNPNNLSPSPHKDFKTGSELFQEEIDNIYDKFIHSLNLYAAIAIGVAKMGFPQEYIPPTKSSILFILVINSFEKSWCLDVEIALMKKIHESICMNKIWKVKVHVINHETAIKQNLAVE